ncbi:MAG: helix-turn-helix transcriptional regulator, partial [Actinomycetota bacterium]|nr:helix-turn-helix transcriptional regulator [Actinomycetota bacterium]
MENLLPALLTTKTRVPLLRRGLVRRKDLIQRLSRERDHALTIVRAPAGYGKSTLLQQWALDDARLFAWVQLDPSDNDPVLFWRYVLAALRVQVPGLAESAWRRLASPAPDLDAAITDLLNELLDGPEELVLVLDDYHVIDNPECHRTITFFIDHVAQNTQVVLATRGRLPFSVSRLIARGSVTEIRRRDLEFTPVETAAAVRLRAPAASDETVSRIRERTEGWPVGVYLATWNLDTDASVAIGESEAATVTQRYLIDEMLSHLDDEDRAFVRETSILERLSGNLCDHVTGRTDSSEILARLESANLLLIPLDDVGHWYRYHHLLQEILRADLRDDSCTDESMLHIRASDWFLRHDDASLAIHHAIESGGLMTAG